MVELPTEIILLIIEKLPYCDRMKLAICCKKVWHAIKAKMDLPEDYFDDGWFVKVRDAENDMFYEIAAMYRMNILTKKHGHYFYKMDCAIAWHLSKFSQIEDHEFLERKYSKHIDYLHILGKYKFERLFGEVQNICSCEDYNIKLTFEEINDQEIGQCIRILLFAKNTSNAITLFNKLHPKIYYSMSLSAEQKKTLKLLHFLYFIGLYKFAEKYSPQKLNTTVLSYILKIFNINSAFIKNRLVDIMDKHFNNLLLGSDYIKNKTWEVFFHAAPL